MPAVYTSFWDQYGLQATASGAITDSTTYIPKGANPKVSGDPYELQFNYDLASGTLNATNTPLVICSLPAGTYDLEVVLNQTGTDLDSDNNFTFNLGTVASATAYASASTGLQATTPFRYGPARVTVASGESLRLARQAGDLDSSGRLVGLVRITAPAA